MYLECSQGQGVIPKILYRFRGEAPRYDSSSIDYVITLTGGTPSGGR